MQDQAHTLYLQLTSRMAHVGQLMHGMSYGASYRNLQAEWSELQDRVDQLRKRHPHTPAY